MARIGRDGRRHVLFPHLADLIPFAGLSLMFDDECKFGHWSHVF